MLINKITNKKSVKYKTFLFIRFRLFAVQYLLIDYRGRFPTLICLIGFCRKALSMFYLTHVVTCQPAIPFYLRYLAMLRNFGYQYFAYFTYFVKFYRKLFYFLAILKIMARKYFFKIFMYL